VGKASDEHAKVAHERHAQIEQLTLTKSVAEKQAQERENQIAQLTEAQDEQVKLTQAHQEQSQKLIQAKTDADDQIKVLSEKLLDKQKELIEFQVSLQKMKIEKNNQIKMQLELDEAEAHIEFFKKNLSRCYEE
ncbi:hypothetical protein, partial [Comamonas sp. E6]|uniref:hypothetical protein n=1 Tax=Comamonas sp. E6 TaxID=364029 RepID=UPI000637CE57